MDNSLNMPGPMLFRLTLLTNKAWLILIVRAFPSAQAFWHDANAHRHGSTLVPAGTAGAPLVAAQPG